MTPFTSANERKSLAVESSGVVSESLIAAPTSRVPPCRRRRRYLRRSRRPEQKSCFDRAMQSPIYRRFETLAASPHNHPHMPGSLYQWRPSTMSRIPPSTSLRRCNAADRTPTPRLGRWEQSKIHARIGSSVAHRDIHPLATACDQRTSVR